MGDRCRRDQPAEHPPRPGSRGRVRTPDRPRFVDRLDRPGHEDAVAHRPGPSTPTSTRSPTPTAPQFAALIEERVDALLIETCFDILQAKCVGDHRHRGDEASRRAPAADGAAHHHRRPTGGCCPAPTSPRRCDAATRSTRSTCIGMNCGVGPDLMLERHPAPEPALHAKLLSVLPNAGLPETRGDETYFPLDPPDSAEWLERFVTEFGVNIVGGCCGTTHEHLRRSCDRLGGKKPAPAAPGVPPGRVEPAQRPGTVVRIRGRCWSASGRTPTARGSSSNSSKRKTGTASSRWPRSRSARASTSSTCAWTTSAATASAT